MQYELKTIPCKTCGINFLPKSPKNVYCKRTCFKKAYYNHKKIVDQNAKKYPSFICPSCGKKVDLDFDPLVNDLKWSRFECPFCCTLMISVCEYISTEDTKI